MKFKYLFDPLFLGSLLIYITCKSISLDHSNFAFIFWNHYLTDILLIPVAIPIILLPLKLFRLRIDSAPNLKEILIPLVIWSVSFEIVAPYFLSTATGDFYDILAYSFGALISWLSWNFIYHTNNIFLIKGNYSFLTKLLIRLISLYQNLAPKFIRKTCAFTPTCSDYGKLALMKYGAIRGVKATFFRLMRCYPSSGGIDYP